MQEAGPFPTRSRSEGEAIDLSRPVTTSESKTAAVPQAGAGGPRPAPKVPEVTRGQVERQEMLLAGMLLAPALLAVLTIAIWPVIQNFWISFHYWKLNDMANIEFIGLQNYITVLTDPQTRFLSALWVTFRFAFFSISLQLLLGLGLALLINQSFRGRGLVRAAVLIPWAIPTAISGMMWKFMFDAQLGVINDVFVRLGLIDGYIAWLGKVNTALGGIIAADVWKLTPFVALLLLAGLQVIPGELYEAARVDGAGWWTQLWRITLPLLKPSILVVLVFRTIDALRAFEIVFVMTGGGPGNSTETAGVFAYLTMMRHLDFGKGSAISVLIILCTAFLSYLYVRFLGARVGREA